MRYTYSASVKLIGDENNFIDGFSIEIAQQNQLIRKILKPLLLIVANS